MKRVIAIIATIAVGCLATSAQAQGDIAAKAEATAVNLCSTCHGPRGISVSPEFPILAAQQESYLAAQIEAFRSRTRSEKDAHDFMWGIASRLPADVIQGLAHYYAMQPPPPGRMGDAVLVARGKQLYDSGVPDRGVPACAACHGPAAAGSEAFPRLAGQHAKYVAKQLAYIQTLVRAAPVMHGIVKDFTASEIQAVAAYVESL